MEAILSLFVVFIYLLIITGIISLPFIGILNFILSPLREKLVHVRYQLFPYRHHLEIIRALVQYFPYYNKLNNENRRRFELRLLIFMKSKKFIPMNGMILTERMKILISASAVQLTFGLSYYQLRHFYVIYVYPESYLYKHYKVKFRGHVSDLGSIHLSWNNFEKGYLFPDDGVNLGLHELMHALKVYALQYHVDFTFYDNNEILEKLARVEMQKMKTKPVEFLKNRLVNNRDEFLAVCAECFFELPQQFHNELPEVYASMRKLLNQDPLRPQNPVLQGYSEGGIYQPEGLLDFLFK